MELNSKDFSYMSSIFLFIDLIKIFIKHLTMERMFHIMVMKVIWNDERDIVRVL